MKIKNLALAAGLLLAGYGVEAQVSKVNYKVQFNKETNLFDCFMIVKEGQASSVRERAQFNAQMTVVVPAGSQVKLAENHNPIQNNQNFAGTEPTIWSISNQNSGPESDPFRDFISIAPSMSPSSFYGNVKAGDEIKLFSLQITPIVDCGSNVRLYEAGLDPSSGERGMHGGDFSNGFTMGGVQQLYAGNAPSVTPTINVIKDHSTRALKGKLNIDLNVDLNQKYGPYTFVWNGPNGYKSYIEDVVINNANSIHEGNYYVEVADNRGCKQSSNIFAKIHGQNIGLDETKNVNLDAQNEGRNEVATEVNIYPNPAITFFNLDVIARNGATISYDLLDSNGSAILSKSLGAKATGNHANVAIPLTSIPSGAYTVAVTVDGELTTKKLIVIK